jgi:predicted exporter
LQQPLPLGTLAIVLLVMIAAAWQWRDGPPLSTDLTALLPTLEQTAQEQRAQQRVEQRLNERLLLLIGHDQRSHASALAEQTATQLNTCGCFEWVRWQQQPDLDKVGQQLLAGRLALLDNATRDQLLHHPERYLAQRAAALFDPFSAGGVVAPDRDWLGLTRHISLPQGNGDIAIDATTGAVTIEADERIWILAEARINTTSFDVAAPVAVRDAVALARAQVTAGGGELLALGGVLYAAAARDQAAAEVAWVGGGSVIGIILLLLFAFRSPRALMALLPVSLGLVCGAVASVGLFGEIHVLTLVLGASLIGVAIDYPLHYLSKSWLTKRQDQQHEDAAPQWHSLTALRSTLPGLRLSLATSVVGYGALLFTPFPALTQIAVFSIAGLGGAFLVAVGLLPALLAGTRLQPASRPLALVAAIERQRRRLSSRQQISLALVAALLTAYGIARLDSSNDVRQWIRTPPELINEARRIADLTGEQPTSQFFIVEGEDVDTVMARSRALSERLAALTEQNVLSSFRSIDQFIASPAEQLQLRHALAKLSAQFEPLIAVGIPAEQLQAELAVLQSTPLLTPDQALTGPLGEPWRDLWLAGSSDESPAALVTLSGLNNGSVLARLAGELPGVRYVDRVAALDAALDQVQWRALLLKAIATLILLALVALAIGLRPAMAIVGLPFAAALLAAGALGLLGQPLTLFGLFGLLLATAVGVDYAILIHERVGGMVVSLLGVVVAAVTAWLSFGLLALSQTPAVSNFGLAVTLGLVFCVLLAPWAVPSGELRKSCE